MASRSTELMYFYRAYKNWLDEGALPDPVFSRRHGLCSCLVGWCYATDRRDLLIELLDAIKYQFVLASKHGTFPFGEEAYQEERVLKGMHLNPQRIKWVEDHC